MRDEGSGVIVYLRLDGRGAGLAAKVAATALEVDEGLDTYDSRLRIGVHPDNRDYTAVGRYLATQGLTSARLLTNNPEKACDIRTYVPSARVEPLRVEAPSAYIEQLYATKHAKFHHST
jgi:GTP cyclohydrolase II